MHVVELPGTIGCEVHGIDLGAMTDIATGWTAAQIDLLRAEWNRRHLLLLRGPVVAGEQQLSFVARFGSLVPESNLWAYVSNVRADGIVREGALLFHSDFAFTPYPIDGISLHAIEVPAGGASTRFADAVRAAAALSPDLRARLSRCEVLNVYDFHRPDDQPMRVGEVDDRAPRCVHPVIAPHPRTGEPVVMANELHTDSIVGVPAVESRKLLDDLFAVLYDEVHVFEHRWAVGDLVLWDNIALHHGRRDIPRDEPRTLQRVTLGSYSPAESVPGLGALLRSS